jgi:hypothetical protein
MIALILAASSLQVQDPQIEALSSHLRALEGVPTGSVIQPMMSCLNARFDAHTPAASELGNLPAAAQFARTQLLACNFEQARAALVSMIRAHDRTLTAETAAERANAGMQMPALVTFMKAYKHFQIKSPRGPALPPITVPCSVDPNDKNLIPCPEAKSENAQN